MNPAPKELALALAILALTTSCIVASNTSTQTQQPPSVTEVRDSGKVATTIKIDGSSTVYPITEAIAKDYQADPKNRVQVAVNISGTTGRFEKFCAGETDISNASRPILKAKQR